MSRYWKKEAETKETLTPDGWCRSGDVGIIDDDGYIYIVDRLKDLVIRGGENISCNEVEDAIYALEDDVYEVGVFGLPHERLGEQLCAAVVCLPGSKLTQAQLGDFLTDKLAKYKVPAHIFLRDKDTMLPRGPTGKILKRALREEYKDNV
jgi:acyl-CoA synthetase (AMP-forming)/AMP-acid ligase II